MSQNDEPEQIPESTMSRKGRRPGIAVYDHNPFVRSAAADTKIGTKRLASKDGQRFMIVSAEGEIMAPAGFHEVVEVDRTQFVKLYSNGVRAFAGLSPAGAKVFEVIYTAVAGQPGADRIWVHYKDVDQQATPMSPATFKRGMRELLEAQFIAESDRPGMYWLNVAFLFNGNRLAFIREYRTRPATDDRRNTDQAHREALEQRGQQRLSD